MTFSFNQHNSHINGQREKFKVDKARNYYFVSGSKTNLIKSIDSVLTTLLIKIADTNRFIRADSTAALESMTENLTIHKAVSLLHYYGARHKNIPAKTFTARVLGNIVKSISGDKFIEMAIESRDTYTKVSI